MYQPYDQKARPSDPGQGGEVYSVGNSHVGDQDDDRREELQQRAVDTCHILDKFVEQDDRRVENGGAKSEEDADQVAASPGEIVDPDDIMTSPSVDIQKQRICFAVSFSRKRSGDATVTMTGAK